MTVQNESYGTGKMKPCECKCSCMMMTNSNKEICTYCEGGQHE